MPIDGGDCITTATHTLDKDHSMPASPMGGAVDTEVDGGEGESESSDVAGSASSDPTLPVED